MIRRRRRRTRPSAAASLVACLLVAAAGGCELLGLAAYKTSGPAKVPPAYIPEHEPMLVLVENFRTASQSTVDADRVARYLSDDLKEYDVAPLIDPDRLFNLRDTTGQAYSKMTIDQIGHAVGAAQVLYVNVTDLTTDVPVGSTQGKGTADAKVRVIDVTTGETRWPVDMKDGEPIHTETDYVDTAGSDAAAAIRQATCHALATDIGKKLHAWTPSSEAPDSK